MPKYGKIVLLNFLKLCTIWEAEIGDFFYPGEMSQFGFDWMTVHFVEYMVVGRFLAISETSVYILYKSINIYKSNVLWWGRAFLPRLILPDICLPTLPTTLSLARVTYIPYDTNITIIISNPLLDRRETNSDKYSPCFTFSFVNYFSIFVLFSVLIAWQKE